ncbi:hypothetical protein [Phage f2b1]|nr:hypothetical protein [Phage f2b1]
MKKAEGQCFDCYGTAMFNYHGMTEGFSERKMKLDYVAGLEKPATIVKCVTCDRDLKYTEDNGFWHTEILEKQGGKQ